MRVFLVFAEKYKEGEMFVPLAAWWGFNAGFVAIASALVVFVAGVRKQD